MAQRSIFGGPDTDPAAIVNSDAEFIAMRPHLARLAFSMTRSREDAEDAVQEVWLRWRRHRGSITAVPHWLRTVTRNVVIDRLRDHKADRAATHDVALGPEPSTEPVTPVVEAALELRPAFHAVLSSLSPLERAVFVLHEGLDWSYVDIARLLDRSESAVRQLRHRAKHHLASGARRFTVDPTAADAIAAAYVHVSAGSDVFTLMEVLAPGLASKSPVFWSQDRKVVHDVAGILLFQEDRLLLCHRRDALAWYPGVWDVPGSHLRHGEPAIACATRAARQKLDISVTDPHRLVEHSESDYRLTLFEAVGWVGEPRNLSTAQHDEIGLYTRDQASHLHLVDRRLLTLFDRSAAEPSRLSRRTR